MQSQQDSKTKSTGLFVPRRSVQKQPSSKHVPDTPAIHQRSMSEGLTYNERRIEYEDVLYTDGQFSQDSKDKSKKLFKRRRSVQNQPSSTYIPHTPAIHQRCMSDGLTYSEGRIAYADVLSTDSQFSQSQGYVSEQLSSP